jgi:RNA polymerase sigma factor (sigma-70 family)
VAQPFDLTDAYQRYAARLLAYCRGFLDRDGAADAVQDTFLIAARRAEQLREPARLGAWLYAIARHECLRQLRARERQAPLDFDLAAATADPTASAQTADVVELITSATAGLSAGDREIIELAIRHELSAVDIGAVLGISVNHAHARLSRARGQLGQALQALLVARDRSCAALGELLSTWDGQMDPLTRKRINRHAANCDVCSTRRRELFSPASLLSAYAALPFLAAPVFAADRPSPSIRLAPRTGFPVTEVRRRHRLLAVTAATLAVGAVLIAAAVSCAGQLAGPGSPTAAMSGADEGRLAPPAVDPSGPPPPTPAPPLTSMPQFTPAPPGPSSPSTVPPPLPLAVSVVERSATCTVQSGTFRLYVRVAVTRPVSSARLYWIEGTGPRHSLPLTSTTETTAEVTKILLRDPTVWWVGVNAADGAAAETPHVTVANPCV